MAASGKAVLATKHSSRLAEKRLPQHAATFERLAVIGPTGLATGDTALERR